MAQSYKLIKDFITKEESLSVVKWIDTLQEIENRPNRHLAELGKKVKGRSFIFDIADTPITNYITKFQSISGVRYEPVPECIWKVLGKIMLTLGLNQEHIFLQAVDMQEGGKIDPHYDAAVDGYINYKCNVSILSEDYSMYIGDDSVLVQEGDLYAFEASLYKHWTQPFGSRRVFLSFGFMLKYEDLGRNENDPRVRLSRRIKKYFQ